MGYSVSTVGLSALYPDLKTENAIVFLDTAGTETPVYYNLYSRYAIWKKMKQHEPKNLTRMIKKLMKQGIMAHQVFIRNNYEIKLKDRLLTEHLI